MKKIGAGTEKTLIITIRRNALRSGKVGRVFSMSFRIDSKKHCEPKVSFY